MKYKKSVISVIGKNIAPIVPIIVTATASHLLLIFLVIASPETPAEYASKNVVVTVDKTIIKRYKTILFEEYHSELVAVCCCVLDSSLQVVEEEDWSAYITHSESVVVDIVTDSNEPNVSGIKLKDKAKKKVKQRELVALKETAQEQNA